MAGWLSMREKAGTMRDEQQERRIVLRRFQLLALAVIIAISLLGFRYASLQLGGFETYAARAEDNRVRLRPLPPNRGLILDRHGRVVAENRPAFRLVLVPERTGDVTAMLAELEALVTISEDELGRFHRQRQRSRPFESIILKTALDEEELARLAVNRHRLTGVEVEPYLTRHYPYGELLAHVVGYVGRIDEADLRRLGRERYRGTTHVGKTGIERFYEHRLHGQTGVERVETNAQGRVLQVMERTDPVPGEDIVLTIDIDIQAEAVAALGHYAGAVVVIDIHTGEVLALVSQPGFDPNRFVHGVSREYYQGLLSSPQRPLFNRFLAGGYEPGSTIKPFIALAGLEAGLISPETRVFSRGWFELPGHSRRYRDWREGGHGWVNLESALAESVNVYFYQLAVDLGIDRISRELALFGFGRATGLDLLGEQHGILPTRRWKMATFGEPWFPGETVITGIGQGFTVVTPLQLAHATAALAGRGQTAPPWLVDPRPHQRMIDHHPDHWGAVFEGLKAVVHGPRGTAREVAAQLPFMVAGKTGTAQVYGLPQDEQERRDRDEVPEHLRNHALFTGFAPLEDPRFAVTVVVEHGGGGASVAAPAAARVLRVLAETP